MQRLLGVLAVWAGLVAPGALRAQDWEVAAGVATDFPVDIGARLDVESPQRIRGSLGIGFMPEAYAETINAFLVAVDAWSEPTGDLVVQTIQSSLVLRLHGGWRPFADEGFYAMLGYGLATLGGDASGADIIAGVIGREVPTGAAGETPYDLSATIHMLDLEFGWEWTFDERWRIRAALGGMFTLAATATVEPQEPAANERAQQTFTDATEAYLEDLITSYVHTPVLTVGASYVF